MIFSALFFIFDFNNEKWIAEYIYRDTKKCSGAVLNKRIASKDWRAMYQQKDANSTFQMFSDLFENVLKNLAPIKIEEPTSSPIKKWISKDLLKPINEKHRLFKVF